jgi:ferritin-like metal-binding protein YciE
MKTEGLRQIYLDELKDLYDAENQLVKALPKMAKGAESEELRSAFEDHLEQTREHVSRLERVFKSMGENPKGKKCKGMQGLIEEGNEQLGEDYDGEEMDAALIVAAQKVEHYEIAGYGSARTFASILGEEEAVSLLEQTLEEEKETDQKLTDIAEEINLDAADESEEEMGEESEEKQPRSTSTRKGKARSARAS